MRKFKKFVKLTENFRWQLHFHEIFWHQKSTWIIWHELHLPNLIILFLYITGNELFVPIDHYVFQAYFSPNTSFEFHIQWAESSFLKGSESASYKISILVYAFNSQQTRIQSNHISKIFVCFDHSFDSKSKKLKISHLLIQIPPKN